MTSAVCEGTREMKRRERTRTFQLRGYTDICRLVVIFVRVLYGSKRGQRQQSLYACTYKFSCINEVWNKRVEQPPCPSFGCIACFPSERDVLCARWCRANNIFYVGNLLIARNTLWQAGHDLLSLVYCHQDLFPCSS